MNAVGGVLGAALLLSLAWAWVRHSYRNSPSGPDSGTAESERTRYYTYTPSGVTVAMRERALGQKKEEMLAQGWTVERQFQRRGNTYVTFRKDPVEPTPADRAAERRRAAAGHAFLLSAVTPDLCAICSYEAKHHDPSAPLVAPPPTWQETITNEPTGHPPGSFRDRWVKGRRLAQGPKRPENG
jgi:hypothetical protein